MLVPPTPGYHWMTQDPFTLLPMFRGLDDQQSNSSGSARPKGPWRQLLEGANEGGRNDSLTRLVGVMLAKGTLRDFARMAALEFGRRCRPPMDPREIERTFDSIAKRDRAQRGRTPILVNLIDIEP